MDNTVKTIGTYSINIHEEKSYCHNATTVIDMHLPSPGAKAKAYNRMIDTFKKLRTPRIKEIGKLESMHFTRNRKMPFDDLALYLLSQKGKTTAMEINNYFKEINKREDRVTKQNFSKQRCNLNPEVFKQLGKEYVQSIYDSSEYKTYKGYILTAIDGTTFELPNTKDLQIEYESYPSGEEALRTIVRARGSGIYDVENNIMIDAVMGKYTTDERTLAAQNISNMFLILGTEKEILTIFDRGYISMDMLLSINKLPIKYLFRLSSNIFKTERKSMTCNDEIISIKMNNNRLAGLNYENLTDVKNGLDNIKVRIIRIPLSTGETEYLLTNLDSNEVTIEEMGELYFKRWGIETAYDVLKNKLCIENISGKKKIIIEQDFYAQMLLFNMVEDLKNDANRELEDKKNKELKYEYKVNMNILVGTLRNYMIKIAIEEDEEKCRHMYQYMMEEIMENLVPIRTGRQKPRKPYTGTNKHKTNIRRNS